MALSSGRDWVGMIKFGRFLFLLAQSVVGPVAMWVHSQRLFLKAGEDESHWNEVKLLSVSRKLVYATDTYDPYD